MIELIRQRRSIRSFTGQPVDEPARQILIEALLRSPSSRNINPWEFLVIDQPELLEKLARAKKHGSAFLKGAPLGIVVCADSRASDVWVEDCSIAAILLQMTAQSLGLGSCWIQIRKRQHSDSVTSEAYIRDLLGLPEHMTLLAIIAIGHPAEHHSPLEASKLQQHKIHHNRFNACSQSAP